VTVSTDYGDLDARTQIGHFTRNIKVVPGPDSGWGYTIYNYGYKDSDNITRIGSVSINGVQFLNGGQHDTQNAVLNFFNSVGGNVSSTVTGSSFQNCFSYCLYANNA
jgi:hypothetical protein